MNQLSAWKVNGNTVTCPNGVQVEFPFEVMKYTLIDDNLLVLLRMPYGTRLSENAFMISPAGAIVWRVAQIPEMANSDSDFYIGFFDRFEEDKKNQTMRLASWKGTINTIDITTGKSISTYWGK